MPMIAIIGFADTGRDPTYVQENMPELWSNYQYSNTLIHDMPPPCYHPAMAIRPPARRAYAPARANWRAFGNYLIHEVLSPKSRANFEAKPIIHPVFGL